MKILIPLLLFCIFHNASAQYSGFTENRGQLIDTDGKPRVDILFTASSLDAQFYFMNDKVIAVEGLKENDKQNFLLQNQSFTKKEILFKNLPAFKNSSVKTLSTPAVRFEEPLTVRSNYYLPHCPDGITGVRSFKKVVYENIAENTDLVFEMLSNGMVESYFVNKENNSRIENPQITSPAIEPNIITDSRVVYSSYIGGSTHDYPGGITSDSHSNFWVGGATSSNNFPLTDSALEKTKTVKGVSFISKFSATGELLYSTFYGGNAGGMVKSLAIDSEDNPVIAGFSAGEAFPVSAGAFQTKVKGAEDTYILKLDPQGRRLWATLFGGTATDYPTYVAVDKQDNIIFTGETRSGDNFPVSENAVQTQYGGGVSDAFVAKFDKNGARLWSTFFGGEDNYQTTRPIGGDKGNWVVTDSDDNVIITGTAGTAINFPTTDGAFQKDSSFMTDAFLAKFTPDGDRLWCTLYGGKGVHRTFIGATDDEGRSVVVDRDNNIIMVGGSSSKDLAITPDALVKEPNLEGGGFMIKFTAQGERVWATYYSGSMKQIKADKYGNTYITGSGRNGENGFYESDNSIKMTNANNGGMYIASFKEQQPQFVTTYPRFDGITSPSDITLARNGYIAMFGHTDSGFLPVTANALMPTNPHTTNGYDKAFLIILRDISTGIDEVQSLKNQTLVVQPNPAQDKISLALPEGHEEALITITNILGQEVLKTAFVKNGYEDFIDVSALPTGTYFLRADAKGVSFTATFVRQ
jgi:hypothetical protein